MAKTSKKHSELLRHPVVWLTVALVLIVGTCVLWIFFTVSAQVSTHMNADTDGAARETVLNLSVRLMQFTLGMLIGLVCMLLGVLLAWFGVNVGTVEGELETPALKGKLLAASPGMLLIVCGTLLIMTCLLKNFEVSTTVLPSVISIDEPNGGA